MHKQQIVWDDHISQDITRKHFGYKNWLINLFTLHKKYMKRDRPPFANLCNLKMNIIYLYLSEASLQNPKKQMPNKWAGDSESSRVVATSSIIMQNDFFLQCGRVVGQLFLSALRGFLIWYWQQVKGRVPKKSATRFTHLSLFCWWPGRAKTPKYPAPVATEKEWGRQRRNNKVSNNKKTGN